MHKRLIAQPTQRQTDSASKAHAAASGARIIIDVAKLGKTYANGEAAIKDVSFKLHEGERVAIVGHSGSGKSTLLNTLATLDYPTEGEYWFDGQRVAARHRGIWQSSLVNEWRRYRWRRKMGFVFQTPFMLANFNAAYNMSLGSRVGGHVIPGDKEMADLCVSLGLSASLARKTSDELSGGQRQRIAIARAIMHRPLVVFADEPTGSLDVYTAEQVMEHLKTVCVDQDIALVVVTHSPKIAAAYTDRIIGLNGGRICLDHHIVRDDPAERTRSRELIEQFLCRTPAEGVTVGEA